MEKKGAFDSTERTASKHSTCTSPCASLCQSHSLNVTHPIGAVLTASCMCVCLCVCVPGNSRQVGYQPSQVFLFYSVVITPRGKCQDRSSSFVSPTCAHIEDRRQKCLMMPRMQHLKEYYIPFINKYHINTSSNMTSILGTSGDPVAKA